MKTGLKDFQFKPRKNGDGKYFIEVTYGGVVVATGKNAHDEIEPAMSEVLSALDQLDLASVIVPNGKLLEVYP